MICAILIGSFVTTKVEAICYEATTGGFEEVKGQLVFICPYTGGIPCMFASKCDQE